MSTDTPSHNNRNWFFLYLEAWSFAMGRCRFSVIVLIAGFALLMSAQGQDLLIALGEDDRTLFVTLWSAIWAWSIWLWSRTLLDINFKKRSGGYDDRYYYHARMWLARVLGGLAFGAVAWSAFQAEQTALGWWTSAGFVVFVTFVWQRRYLSAQMSTGAKKIGFTKTARWLEIEQISKEGSKPPPPYNDLKEALAFGCYDEEKKQWNWLKDLGSRAVMFLFLIVVWCGLFIWATFWPVSLGTLFGAMVLFFIWGASFLPLGSVLSYWADKKRIPILTVLLLWAIAISSWNDNHEIRFITEPDAQQDAAQIAKRKTVSDGLDIWRNSNASTGKPVPFVVVATAGGGIRAAYWTGTVLGNVQDENSAFARRLFAVSGVSGGSVGATAYRAFVELDQLHPQQYTCIDDQQDNQSNGRQKGRMEDCLQKVLGKTLLGPVAAALLFPDLIQRFWPWPWFPGRGAALEQGWENAFQKVIIDNTKTVRPEWNLLREQGIAGLRGEPHKPALFLNSTWTDNGRRIVASNLRFANAKTAGKSENAEVIAFTRSNDQLAVLGRDLRLSTAAHNSARFPAVSPPGMWKKEDEIKGRLQDGGLFENYGAETALEILELACQKFNCVNKDTKPVQAGPSSSNNKPAVFPVVILISSDPSLWKNGSDVQQDSGDTCASENLAQSEENEPIGFAYELRSTLRAYERVRGGRGKEAADRLCRASKAHNGEFVHFSMCDPKAKGSPPLGWALSDKAKERIESYLIPSDDPPPCYQRNHDYLVKLNDILK